MYQLTRDDIAALTLADVVGFTYRDMTGSISAIVAAPRGATRIYSAKEQRVFPLTQDSDRSRVIDVRTTIDGYNDDMSPWSMATDPLVSAFTAVPYAQSDGAWGTIVQLLRVDDALWLQWEASNNTGSQRKAGLHADRLVLVVIRQERRLTFNIATEVGPDMPGRMIRRLGD